MRGSYKWEFLVFLSFFCFGCEQVVKDHQKEVEKSHIPKLYVEELNSSTSNSLRGISVVDSNIAWLSGAKGSILKTTNGGENWEILPMPDEDSLDFRDVEAFNENEAIVVSAGFPSRVYRTNDGGEHWSLVHENIDSSSFMNSITFRNRKEGIIFGDQINGRHLI